MDWLLSTTEAISKNIAQRRSKLAEEEQYCNTLRSLIDEAEKEKEQLNAEIDPLLGSINSLRKRYTADSETRKRLQESASLAREKQRMQEQVLIKERERHRKLNEKMAESQKKYHEIINKMKEKFPKEFSDTDDKIAYLNKLRTKKMKLKENILYLEKFVSAPENNDWNCWKQYVIRLADFMVMRKYKFQRYGSEYGEEPVNAMEKNYGGNLSNSEYPWVDMEITNYNQTPTMTLDSKPMSWANDHLVNVSSKTSQPSSQSQVDPRISLIQNREISQCHQAPEKATLHRSYEESEGSNSNPNKPSRNFASLDKVRPKDLTEHPVGVNPDNLISEIQRESAYDCHVDSQHEKPVDPHHNLYVDSQHKRQMDSLHNLHENSMREKHGGSLHDNLVDSQFEKHVDSLHSKRDSKQEKQIDYHRDRLVRAQQDSRMEVVDFTLMENDAMDIELEENVLKEPIGKSSNSSQPVNDSGFHELDQDGTPKHNKSEEKSGNKIKIKPTDRTASPSAIRGDFNHSTQIGESIEVFQETQELQKDSSPSLPTTSDSVTHGKSTSNLEMKGDLSPIKDTRKLVMPAILVSPEITRNESTFSLSDSGSMFSSPSSNQSTAKFGVSQNPVLDGRPLTTSKYFSCFSTSSPILKAFGSPNIVQRKFGQLDSEEHPSQLDDSLLEEQEEPMDSASTDFEKSFELLDLQQATVGGNESHGQEPSSSVQNKLAVEGIRDEVTNVTASSNVSVFSDGTEESSEIAQNVPLVGRTIEAKKDLGNVVSFNESSKTLEEPQLSPDHDKVSNENSPFFEKTKRQFVPEVFANAPRQQERQAYIQSLKRSSPDFSYTPMLSSKLSSVTKESGTKQHCPKPTQISESIWNRGHEPSSQHGIGLLEEMQNQPAAVPSSEDTSDPVMQRPLSQPFSPQSIRDTSTPKSPQPPIFTRPLTPEPCRGFNRSFHRGSNRHFASDLYDSRETGFTPKAADNGFSLYDSPNLKDSQPLDCGFSIFGTGGGDSQPGTPDGDGFTFNFGMGGSTEAKSPPGQENNFFSLFSSSQSSSDEKSDAPSFKLF